MNIPTTDLNEWIRVNTHRLTASTTMPDTEAYREYDPQGAFKYAREKLVVEIADELLHLGLVTFKQRRCVENCANYIEVSCNILKPRVGRNAKAGT